jgi:hypothetical protein
MEMTKSSGPSRISSFFLCVSTSPATTGLVIPSAEVVGLIHKGRKMMILFLLAILFIILNVLDITTTRKVLKNGGYEANPIARLLMRFHLFIPAKIIMVLLILLIMLMAEEETGITTGIICCGIYIFIVLNNLRTFRLQSQD